MIIVTKLRAVENLCLIFEFFLNLSTVSLEYISDGLFLVKRQIDLIETKIRNKVKRIKTDKVPILYSLLLFLNF